MELEWDWLGVLSKFRYSEGEISKKIICIELFLFEQAVMSQPVFYPSSI